MSYISVSIYPNREGAIEPILEGARECIREVSLEAAGSKSEKSENGAGYCCTGGCLPGTGRGGISDGLFFTLFGVGKLGFSRDGGGLNSLFLPREGITDVALLSFMNTGAPYLTFFSYFYSYSKDFSRSFAERTPKLGSDLVN